MLQELLNDKQYNTSRHNDTAQTAQPLAVSSQQWRRKNCSRMSSIKKFVMMPQLLNDEQYNPTGVRIE